MDSRQFAKELAPFLAEELIHQLENRGRLLRATRSCEWRKEDETCPDQNHPMPESWALIASETAGDSWSEMEAERIIARMQQKKRLKK